MPVYNIIELLNKLFLVSSELLHEAVNLHNFLHFHSDLMSNCLGGGDSDRQDMMSSDSGTEWAELEQLFTRKYYNERDLLVNTKAVSQLVNTILNNVYGSNEW